MIDDPVTRRSGWAQRQDPRGNEVQLRGLPGSHAAGLPGADVSARLGRHGQGRRVSEPDPRDHYSYTLLRRSQNGGQLRRSAVRRTHRRVRRGHAGQGAVEFCRHEFRAGGFSTSAPAPAGRRCSSLAVARVVTGIDASERDAGRGPAAGRRGRPRRDLRRRRRACPGLSGSIVRRRDQPPGPDAHARTGAGVSPSCAVSAISW